MFAAVQPQILLFILSFLVCLELSLQCCVSQCVFHIQCAFYLLLRFSLPHTHTRIAKEIVSAAQTFAVIVIINVCCRDLLPSRNSFFAIVGHRRNLKPTYVAASFIYSSYRAYR